MARTLSITYEEYGTKIGKIKFYLDGTEVLSLSNKQSGGVTIPDDEAHVVTAKIWGVFRIFKDKIPAGTENWRIDFEQPNPMMNGRFKLRRD